MTDLARRTHDILERLEDELSGLAYHWRGNPDPQVAESLVTQYQAILNGMLALGYNDWLDADAELPNELMPPAYFQRP
jgi:hypothetical protein